MYLFICVALISDPTGLCVAKSTSLYVLFGPFSRNKIWAFVLITQPCNCSVSRKTNYLPTRLSLCQHISDNITVSHPVNLALLQQFFNDSSLDGVLHHLF